MTSKRKALFKATANASTTLIFLVLNAQSSSAYEYSIRHAFCLDYARSRSNYNTTTYYYDSQSAYNYCIRRANTLIKEREDYQRREARRNAERRRKREIEERARRDEEIRRKEQEKRAEELRQKRIQETVNNAHQLFR